MQLCMEFETGSISVEDGFWVMYYFLEAHYELSGGTFGTTEILSASTPYNWKGIYDDLMPADRAMISYWNEALERYRREGKPAEKKLK